MQSQLRDLRGQKVLRLDFGAVEVREVLMRGHDAHRVQTVLRVESINNGVDEDLKEDKQQSYRRKTISL